VSPNDAQSAGKILPVVVLALLVLLGVIGIVAAP
jgi:Tfp pilus assembly protein PilX